MFLSSALLTFKQSQVARFNEREERNFLVSLQQKLEQDELSLLLRFAPDARRQIVRHIAERARAAGATWQSAIGAWGGYMVGIAPDLGRDPAVRAWLASTGATPDEVILRLPDLLSEADWARIEAQRTDLPLLTPIRLDAEPLAVRVAHALPLVLWDHVPPARATDWAAAAITAAARLGMADLDDAPVAVTAWRVLYAAGASADPQTWPAEVMQATRPPAERLAMLRARIMLDHGRWA